MNTRKVISLYCYNGNDKMITCQIFDNSYRFSDHLINGVNTGLIESNTPLVGAKEYTNNQDWQLTNKPR